MKKLRFVFTLVVIFHYLNFITAQNDLFLEPFKIIVQNEGDKLKLECIDGCAWKELSFTLIEGEKPQYVDEFGMTSTKDEEFTNTDRSNFIMSFERKGESIFCTSERGTYWDELSFSCSQTNCNAQMDNSGVSVINKSKE